jgi:hypothetical protein
MRAFGIGVRSRCGARRGGWLALAVCVCVWAIALGLAVSSAGAFQTHLFEEGFGPDGTAGTGFERPDALAVDQGTGSVYVGDAFAGTVQRFGALHEPELFTGVSPEIVGGRLTGFRVSFVPQVAVGSHVFYVESGEPGFTRVRAFQADGEPQVFTKGPGAGTNELAGSEVCGVAVDANGDIYVSEFSAGVQVYAPTGEPLARVLQGGVCGLAVDSHGVVYGTQLESPEAGRSGPVVRFVPTVFPVSASTAYEPVSTFDANASFAVAVDPASDHVYVDEGGQVAEYKEAGVRLGVFGMGGANALPGASPNYGAGLAVNSVTGRVYVAQGNFGGQVEVFGPAISVPDVTTGQASEVKPQGSAVLNGVVNPDGVALTGCRFEYVTEQDYRPGTAEPYAQGGVAPCVPAAGAIPTGTPPVGVETPVHAEVRSLTPGVTYHFRLQASNHEGTNHGEDGTWAMPPLPSIDGVSVANLTAHSADLTARINPGGIGTTYRFEYGTSTAYGKSVPVPAAPVGAGSTDVAVTQHVEGLEADAAEPVTYHWRVVATSEAGTTTGVDHTFVYDTTGEGLPDGRVYEMVTPPQKNAARIADEPVFVSEDGSRVIAKTTQCFGGAVSCVVDRQGVGTPVLFSRGSGGWRATPLAPPETQFEPGSSFLASADTGMELFSMPTPPMFEDDLYVREPNGSFLNIGPGTPPSAGAKGPVPFSKGSIVATSDLSHVVFEETEAEGWPFASGQAAYEFVGTGNSVPLLVGVSGGVGSRDLISACGTPLGDYTASTPVPGRLSADGSTVFFTALRCSSGTGANAGVPVPANTVYARIDEDRTVRISERSPADCTGPCQTSPPADAQFLGASVDGSKAFFTSAQQLTNEASEGSGNLYEYDFDNPAGHNLIDVSAGDVSGGGPQVAGVGAISADGSHVYFVAGGVLTTAANSQGATAQSGAVNLYVFARDASHPQGRVQFIATLPASEQESWSTPFNGTGLNANARVNVTPDGRFLVFTSHGVLTADDTRSDGAAQVFRYDAQTGELLRISVGERGFNDNGNGSPGATCEVRCPLDASIVRSNFTAAGPARSDPTMSHDGAYVFFESPVGLTPRALNEVPVGEGSYAENVYEWHKGRVYLISDGRDVSSLGVIGSAVTLLGSDATGANVFFTTADPLVAQDTDTQLDFYDARICKAGESCVASSPPPVVPCVGEACHGTPAAAPLAPGVLSASFSGQGNVKPGPVAVTKRAGRKKIVRCSRGRVSRHGKCVKVRARRGRKANSHRGGK